MSQGSIIKREGKRGVSWLLKYDTGSDPSTGRRSQRYKTVRGTKKDAEKELRKLLNQIDDGTHVDPQKLTVGQWIETWLKDYSEPRVGAKTFERYQELLKLHVIPNLGPHPLQKLTGLHIQQLYTKLRTEGRRSRKRFNNEDPCDEVRGGLSERTVLHVHRVLSHCLLEATKKRIISRNPSDDVSAPRPNASNGSDTSDGSNGEKINALDKDGLNRLLHGFKNHDLFALVALAASTGARRGELLALRWTDVDHEKRTIRIERAVEDTSLRGVRFKPTKNKSSKRTIGMDAGLAELLRKHWKSQVEVCFKLGTRLPQDALLFPRSPLDPSLPRIPRNLSKEFIYRAKALGFEKFRLHDLRHTHATLLLSSGVPVNTVAQRLGHSNPVITLSVYGHVLRRSEDQAVEISGEILRESLLGD